jgi:hypothetical protein
MGQGPAHLEELAPPGEPEAVGQGVVDLGGTEDPEVDDPAPVAGGVFQRRLHEGHLHADPPVLGVDHDLQPPDRGRGAG